MNRAGFFLLLIIVVACSCRQPKQLVYRNVDNFQLKQGDKQQTEVSLDLRLFNPNNYGMKLKDADVDVFVNGNKLGKMEVRDFLAVPGLDTFSMPVMLNVNLSSALPNALQLLMNPEVDIKLAGSVKAGRHGVYIKVPVNYEGKQDIRSALKL
jgi:LEA14-like dessication related protein